MEFAIDHLLSQMEILMMQNEDRSPRLPLGKWSVVLNTCLFALMCYQCQSCSKHLTPWDWHFDKLAISPPFYQHKFTFSLTPRCSDERSYGWLKKGGIASPRFKISSSWDLCYVYIITVNFFLLFCLYRQAHPTSALSPAMSWGELLAHSKTHMAVFFGHYYIWVSRVLTINFDKY